MKNRLIRYKILELVLLIILLPPKRVNASIFGEETVVLIEILSTTAQQLNELEKLVTNTQKYTNKLQKYNELAMDHYFRAERVLFLAEHISSKKETRNLGELNSAIRDLKYSMAELTDMVNEYRKISHDAKADKRIVRNKKKVNQKKLSVAKAQVNKSGRARRNARANQLTAQNTALIYEQNIQLHNTQLDILDQLSNQSKMKSQELEKKQRQEIRKREFYQ